ncbi:hypothetical protein BH18THE1_BH18THE1_09770 [soil metagenome]
MGQIHKKKREVRVLKSEDDYEGHNRKVRYCPSCEEYGFQVALGPKILLKDQPKPGDYDLWLQYTSCGRI